MDRYFEKELQEIDEYFQSEEERSGFQIEDRSSADWVIRKIKGLKMEIDEVDDLAKREIERIKEWQEKETKRAKANIEFFEGRINEYMIRSREYDPDFRRLSLPTGVLRYQKQQDEWIFDEEKTLRFLKETYPDKVKVVEKFSKTELKKHVKETGEMWEGINIVPRDDKIVIDITKEEK